MNSSFTIPKFRLPGFVASIFGKLPQWPHTVVLVTGLNAALKMNLLPIDELIALEEAVYTYRDGLFRPVLRPDREPDLAFAANLSAYLQLLARQEDPDTLFFNRELEITGNTELGLIVKNMLDAIEWPNLPLPRHYSGINQILQSARC